MRRRRSQGTWLPILGTDGGTSENPIQRTTRSLSLDLIAGTVDPLVGVTPVIFDDPQEPNEYSESAALIDLVGNEYLLKRIVGKLWVNPIWRFPASEDFNTEFATSITAVCVAAGFFIARAADAALGESSPIGGTATWQSDYNPLNRNQSREPWIWRRSWILGHPGFNLHAQGVYSRTTGDIDNLNGYYQMPPTNAHYGSVADGPHVDAKSKRRVGADDRLWLAVAALPFPPDPAGEFGMSVAVTADLRVFGQIRKAHNRSAF